MEKKKKKRRTHWTEIDLWHYCFFDCLSLLNKDYFCFAPSLPHPECYVSVLFLVETERSMRLHLRRRGQRFGGLLLSPRRPLVSASTSSKPRLSGARCHCSVALGHGDEGPERLAEGAEEQAAVPACSRLAAMPQAAMSELCWVSSTLRHFSCSVWSALCQSWFRMSQESQETSVPLCNFQYFMWCPHFHCFWEILTFPTCICDGNHRVNPLTQCLCS